MSTTTLFAHDYSGSTGGCPYYHDTALKLYEEAIAKDPTTTVLLWDTANKVVTDEAFRAVLAKQEGRGSTDPYTVAEYITEHDFKGRLILVTDGQVGAYSIDRATELLGEAGWPFSAVEVHLINTGGPVNMSVSCPFTRCCPHLVIEYNEGSKPVTTTVLSEEDAKAISKVETIATAEDYEASEEQLEKVVRARTMGTTGDPSLRDAILAMKKRIIADQSRRLSDTTAADMVAAVRRSDVTAAMALAGQVTDAYYASQNAEYYVSINRLVSMCEGALRNAFDLSGVKAAIQGDRFRRAEEAESVEPADVALTDADAAFECPITLDAEGDVLLLVASEGPAVLAGLDKSIVNAIADCPLNALNYPEVVERIRAKLDHPISLKAAQEAVRAGAPIVKSPMTQRPVLGGIALGCSREQVKCTTRVLAKMVAEGKLLGNPDLWFAVVWRIIEGGSLAHLSPLTEAFRAQMRWRCENNTTYMAMSGLAELPTTRVPLGVAVWYVLASSALSLGGREEPVRAHMAHLNSLGEILELCGYALPEGVQGHISRLRTLLGLLNAAKRDRHRVPAVAKGMYQRTLIVDSRRVSAAVRELETVVAVVPLDGPATEASVAAVKATLPAAWRVLPARELYALCTMVDPSLSAGDITLPYDFGPAAEAAWAGAVPAKGWAYDEARGVAAVPICPNTCRPFYMRAPDGASSWKDASAAFYGIPVSEQLPINRNFGDFVAKYRAYPTFEELITFSYNRVLRGATGRTTLPCVAEALARMVLAENKEAMAAHTPEVYRRRYLDTTLVENRLPVERGERPAPSVKKAPADGDADATPTAAA